GVGANSNIPTATIAITAGSSAPVAVDDLFSIDEDGSITGASLFANNGSGPDHDPNSDPFNVDSVNGAAPTPSLTPHDSPNNAVVAGIAVIAADGSFSFTPTADWSGSTSFTYTINDGTSSSTPATVTIDVAPIADAPEVVVNETGPIQSA